MLNNYNAHAESFPLDAGVTLKLQNGAVELMPYFEWETVTDYGVLYAEQTEFGIAFPILLVGFTSFALSPIYSGKRIVIDGRHFRNDKLTLSAIWRVGIMVGENGYVSTGLLYDFGNSKNTEWFIDNSVNLTNEISFNSWLRYKSEPVYDIKRNKLYNQSDINEVGLSFGYSFHITERWNGYAEIGSVYRGFELNEVTATTSITIIRKF